MDFLFFKFCLSFFFYFFAIYYKTPAIDLTAQTQIFKIYNILAPFSDAKPVLIIEIVQQIGQIELKINGKKEEDILIDRIGQNNIHRTHNRENSFSSSFSSKTPMLFLCSFALHKSRLTFWKNDFQHFLIGCPDVQYG